MDAETDPPEPGDAGLTPLSFFFPDLTPGEARLIDGETARIMERRTRVMAAYRRGRSMDSIRRDLGCSIGTVHHDLHTVFEGYRRLAARTAQEHIADALQRLAAREADIETEWEKSKGESVETYTGKRDGRSPGNEARVRKKQRYGDPRLAALLIQCWDRRCKLLGLLRPDDLKGRGELPPVKYVAGLDPVEAV